MARINVEGCLFTDARYEILADKYGRYTATGMMVHAWKIAQKYFLDDQRLVPINIWELAKLQPVEECGLAERRPDGIYVKGSHDQFEWLKQKRLAGQKSGEIRRERRVMVLNDRSTKTNDRSTVVEHPLNENEPLTLTPTQALTQNTNTVTAHAPHATVPKQKVQSLGSRVWDAYSVSMLKVYGTTPPKNEKTGSQCKKFASYVGEVCAESIASMYPYSKDPWHLKCAHSLNVMLDDHAKLAMAYNQRLKKN